MMCLLLVEKIVLLFLFFFFNDTATTEIYTLSLHDALPISGCIVPPGANLVTPSRTTAPTPVGGLEPRRASRREAAVARSGPFSCFGVPSWRVAPTVAPTPHSRRRGGGP